MTRTPDIYDDDEEWFTSPYTNRLGKVLPRFIEQAFRAEEGYQATIEYEEDGWITLT